MALERYFERIGPLFFTADGGENGLVTLESVSDLKVKQQVKVKATGLPTLKLEVKKILSPTQLLLGPSNARQGSKDGRADQNLHTRTDISAYTVALMASITAEEQSKYPVPKNDQYHSVFEREPTLAWRQIGVDKWGRPWSEDNPVPITGTIEVEATDGIPDTHNIQNITTPVTADTEFSFNLPANTRRYWVSIRNHTAIGRIAYGAGETDTKYWTIERGCIFDSQSMNLPVTETVYMQVGKASQTVEIIAFVKS